MPYHYAPPLEHMRFVIEQVLDAPRSWQACAAFADTDVDTAAAVVAEAGKFASSVLQPINAAGDREGCTLTAGQVRTPRGYREAWRAFVDAGWPALPCDPAWGGQGLPLLVAAATSEMQSTNHGWSMYAGILHGAYEALKAHGSEALKTRYLEKLARGDWLAAMALTEPQAGSDLGMLRTKAVPNADGSLAISGQKIFISGADHDLTENIVHLVLARLPDAPPGSKGISLALVPKFLPDGTRNTWFVDGIEHKMGIHGSATCAVRYEAATGWLIGEPNRGLAAMFVMMNSARLNVGLQGLGHLEMATQNALRYAFEREQFRTPIAHQPAMRHLLLRLQVLTEGLRVICYRAALAIDEAHHHDDAAARERAGRLAALMTPVVKAYGSQQGFAGAAAAQQVYGGYGYVHEFGIEQTVRDARIALVYEGTNEIQAIDLLQRKVLADGGRALAELHADCEAEAVRIDASGDGTLRPFAAALRAQITAAAVATAAVVAAAATDAEAPLRAADDYLQGTAHLLLAWAWAASARATVAAPQPDAARMERLRYALDTLLPQAAVHWQRVRSCATALPPLRQP